jgi:alpha-tubulin suppressor-like RCC1 family protein
LGDNVDGQLGLGVKGGGTGERAVTLHGVTDVVAISAGAAHSLALRSNGATWGFGGTLYGQLAQVSTWDSSLPNIIASDPAVMIGGGWFHSFMLLDSGRLLAWGPNTHGQLALGEARPLDQSVPQRVELVGVRSIAAGRNHTLFAVEVPEPR